MLTLILQFDSFFSLFFPNPPELWKDHVTVIGGAKAWVEGNKQSPAPAYIKPEVGTMCPIHVPLDSV